MEPLIFQYLSDVHSEFYSGNPGKLNKMGIQRKAPYLILAGDIGNPFSKIYEDFIKRMSEIFDKVFLISGNHEYYKHSKHCGDFIDNEEDDGYKWLNFVDEQIRNIVNKFENKNVIYLQNECYKINDDIMIYGGTFWTNIKNDEIENVKEWMRDYQVIPNFTIKTCGELHKTAADNLEKSMEQFNKHKFIVISHHLPSYSLIHPKYLGSNVRLNSAFASEIDVAKDERIVAWIAGHTHCCMQIGKFYVNPIGYPGENLISCKKINKTFKINYYT
jgi:predicted phosphodiesterase